jgi:hypothetical protein
MISRTPDMLTYIQYNKGWPMMGHHTSSADSERAHEVEEMQKARRLMQASGTSLVGLTGFEPATP